MTTPSKPGAGWDDQREQVAAMMPGGLYALRIQRLQTQNAKLAEALRNVLKSDLAGAHSFAEEALAEHDQAKQ